MIIGLSGYAQVGKDTAAAALVGEDFQRRAFADTLRQALVALNPDVKYKGEYFPLADLWEWHGYENLRKHAPQVRELLQRLGTEVGRNMIGENVWVDATFRTLKPGQDYVFTDVRFTNEAEAITARGGIIVRIERPGYGPANSHPSETAMDDYPWDYVVVNSSSEDVLAWQLQNIVSAQRESVLL
jgi:hypothetical protein